MENGRELKAKLKAGEISVGAWGTSYDSAMAVKLSRVGFDWAIIDQEHTPYNVESLKHVLWMYRDSGTLPFVRVQDNRPDLMKISLDLGARGILVPYVGSETEAQRAVAGCKYPPQGVRGWGPTVVTNYYADAAEYYETANDDVFVIVQVEVASILDELDAVAKIDGLDAMFIGPSDLSLSLGIFKQWDHPKFRSAVSKVLDTARENGKAVAIAVDAFGPLEQAAEWIDKNAKGVQLLCTAEDGDLIEIGGQKVLADHLKIFGG
ncbi:MAG: aldolase/citrate lyase family protein [Anaerolineales bacterium]|nr:aldolase/citrate lyase family protein [Anaerolineales bacterium]